MFLKVASQVIATTALVAGFSAFAEITHNGTVSAISGQLSSADANYAESWSWAQLSGLSGASGCASGDEGAGDLAYLAFQDTERYVGSMLLSAYLSGKNVTAIVDDANLYEGNCRLKRLVLTPGLAQDSSTPVTAPILAYDHSNLVMAYTMDNISATTLVDESGKSGGGVITGASSVAGKIGNALSFNGSTNYVDLGDSLDSIFTGANATFSFSFWVKLGALGNNVQLINKTGDSNQGDTERQMFLSATDANKIRFFWYGSVDGSSYRGVDSTSALLQNTWHHIVVSYDGAVATNDGKDRVEIYIDGAVQTGALYSAGTLPNVTPSAAHLSLGAQFGATGPITGQLNGSLDALRIFDKVLDATDVAGLYSEGS